MLTINKGAVVTGVIAACTIVHYVGAASLGSAIKGVNNTSFAEMETNLIDHHRVKRDSGPCATRKAILGGGWIFGFWFWAMGLIAHNAGREDGCQLDWDQG